MFATIADDITQQGIGRGLVVYHWEVSDLYTSTVVHGMALSSLIPVAPPQAMMTDGTLMMEGKYLAVGMG